MLYCLFAATHRNASFLCMKVRFLCMKGFFVILQHKANVFREWKALHFIRISHLLG